MEKLLEGAMVRIVCLVATVFVLVGVVDAQTFGQWEVNTRLATYVYAATVNDSGHVLGQYCYADGTCLWLLGLRTSCEQEARYPVTVNSDAGSQSIEIYCAGELADSPGIYTYAFTEFAKMTDLIMKGTRIGIAIPLRGDEFRVVRFDLTGASTALTSMRAIAATKVLPARQGTRDQKL